MKHFTFFLLLLGLIGCTPETQSQAESDCLNWALKGKRISNTESLRSMTGRGFPFWKDNVFYYAVSTDDIVMESKDYSSRECVKDEKENLFTGYELQNSNGKKIWANQKKFKFQS